MREKLTEDLGKFVLTGILSFIASVIYTTCSVNPSRNVHLVPLVIEKLDACEVNFKNLEAAVKNPNASPDEDYLSYLKALKSQYATQGSSRKIVMEKIVPQELLEGLKQKEILNCARSDPNTVQDLRYNTILVLHVATLLNQPTAYVFRRSCSISFQQENIPLRASTEVIPLSSPSGIITNSELLVIDKTGVLVLYYDTIDAAEAQQAKFTELVKKVDEGRVDLTLTCSVVYDEGLRQIGKKPFTVSSRALIKAGS